VRSYQSHDARLKMREILSAVERGEAVEIRRYHTPTAIVVSPEWFGEASEALSEYRASRTTTTDEGQQQ
jgi:antitoxin (DNA-binding transcriptional repressor) of toxin-antitoxin stability system